MTLRAQVIRLASEFPAGSEERKQLLNTLRGGPGDADLRARVASTKVAKTIGMVGFRLSRGRRPALLAKIHVCRGPYPKEKGNLERPVEVKVWLSSEGKKSSWLKSGQFERALRPLATKALKDEGPFPRDPSGRYSISPQCVGMAEIGEWHEQNAWSNDSHLALRVDTPEIAKYVKAAISKVLPVGGGGVPGSTGYRGSGWSGSGTEWAYHYSSWGIGD